MSLFQSNLRKQIRNLPKILNFVKKIHYYSELFTSLLSARAMRALAALAAAAAQPLGHDVDVSTGLRRSSFSHGNFFDEASSILAKFGKI